MGTKIYNSELTQGMINNAKIASSVDPIPSELSEKVVPVMEVNPRLLKTTNIVRHAISTSSGSSTIYTTEENKDFYLTGAVYSYHVNATADATIGQIIATIDGVARRILGFAKITTTAVVNTVTISFPFPIKIDRNTTITINTTFTLGSVTHEGFIYGYTVDNANA